RGGKAILTGIGGRGKKTLLTQITCQLAAGNALFGHIPFAVSRPQKGAVYIAQDPLSEVRFRVQQQAIALGDGEEVLSPAFFLDFDGRRISVENVEDRTILFRALRQCQAEVVILDPLVAIHDSDENSNAAMRKVLDTLSPFQSETGTAFLLAHHEPKSVDNPN